MSLGVVQPRWFDRQAKSVSDEVRNWPEWMRRAAGIEDCTMMDDPKSKAAKAAYEAIRRVKGKDFELARLASLLAAKTAADDAYVKALRDYLAANYPEATK